MNIGNNLEDNAYPDFLLIYLCTVLVFYIINMCFT